MQDFALRIEIHEGISYLYEIEFHDLVFVFLERLRSTDVIDKRVEAAYIMGKHTFLTHLHNDPNFAELFLIVWRVSQSLRSTPLIRCDFVLKQHFLGLDNPRMMQIRQEQHLHQNIILDLLQELVLLIDHPLQIIQFQDPIFLNNRSEYFARLLL